MQVQIKTGQGDGVVLSPGSGGAQGDKVMPTQFRQVYEPKLLDWIGLRRRDLDSGVWAQDPFTQNTMDVSVTCYADEVKEINMTNDPPGCHC